MREMLLDRERGRGGGRGWDERGRESESAGRVEGGTVIIFECCNLSVPCKYSTLKNTASEDMALGSMDVLGLCT